MVQVEWLGHEKIRVGGRSRSIDIVDQGKVSPLQALLATRLRVAPTRATEWARQPTAGNPSGARLLRGDHNRFAVHCHGGFEPASLGQKACVKWLNTMGVEPLAAPLARKQ